VYPTGRLAGQLFVALALCAQWAYAAPPVPLEAFARLPAETDPVLSADGHYVAWIDHKEPVARVVMFNLQTKKPQRILGVPDRTKLRSLRWLDDETLLIIVSETTSYKGERGVVSTEHFRYIAHDASGGVGRLLPTSYRRSATAPPTKVPSEANMISSHTSKPNTVVMAPVECYACLLEVDTRTGQGTLIKAGDKLTVRWFVDRDGTPVAREDWSWRDKQYRLYALFGNDIKEVLRVDDGSRPDLRGVAPGGGALVLLAPNASGRVAAWALPLDGSPKTLLAEDPGLDVLGVSTDPWTGAIVGIAFGGQQPHYVWIEPAIKHNADLVANAFPGKEVTLTNWTRDGKQVLVAVQTASVPATSYLVNFDTHRADIVAEEYPGLASAKLGPVRAITYAARDGTPIPAYLTLPPDAPHQPLPMVVLPHGGPHEHDEFSFNWLTQFLASRGYAVLQPQFRGSSGYGAAFEQAGYRQWGGLMQDDVTDGVRAMIDEGIADPRHVGIVGASYGGYAALAGAAFTPDLYSCAVSINGISDLPALVRASIPLIGVYYSTTIDYEKAHIGSPTDRNLIDRSPVNAVASIKAPVLIVYGSGDGVVANSQSEAMVQKLREAGKSVDVVTLNGEDHWLSRSDGRIELLRGLEDFLRAHL